MKFALYMFVLLGVPQLDGQQRIEESEHILLRFTFPSFYNGYLKSCCKLYPGGCYKLMDSAGYTCDLLRGRVSKMENNGWIEFKISNVRFVDAGFYRCIVLGTGNQVYADYYIEVSELSRNRSQSHPLPTTTIKALNTSTTKLPESTRPAVAQDHSDSPRVSWSFSLSLAVIVSISAMILITAVLGVFLCRVKAKQKHSDEYGDAWCESLKQEAPDTCGIVYTTVDFRSQEKPTEVYANLRTPKTQTSGAPEFLWRAEHDGMVEYSTLANC